MDEQVKKLRDELNSVKEQFTLKTMALSQKIDSLEKQLAQTGESSSAEEIINFAQVEQIEQVNIPDISAEPASAQVTSEPQTLNSPSLKTVKPAKVYKPSFIDAFFIQLMENIFEWFSPLKTIYESYKARGMLGIFFLTIAGAGLVLAGFGYLMQLLIDEMGSGSKSLLMSLTAGGVIAGGLVLKAKTKFGEFASAIVALGLLLCFSTIYFVGSVYQLIPGLTVLLLYAATALACHYLALWLDTKVIAVLGILGITLMPQLTGSTIIEPSYYVIALLFVSASSLYIAYKHIGHWLAELSFAFSFFALAWLDAANAIFMSAWMINAFYILFSAYIILNLFLHKKPTKRFLVMLVAVLGGTLLLLLQGLEQASLDNAFALTSIKLQMLVNAALACSVAWLFFKVKHEHIAIMVLVAATWIVLSIIAFLETSYWGIAWAIEALLLIFMSRHYKLPSIVHQGQILALIALSYCLIAVFPYFPTPALQSKDGWLIVIMIVLLVSLWQRIIKPIKNNEGVQYSLYVQANIYPLLVLAESVFLSVVVLACAFIYLDEWAGLSAIFVQVAILFRAKFVQTTKSNKTSLEIFASLLILFPLAYAAMGIIDANSFRFSMLPLYAKSALIIAFLQLWLWSAFYRKFNPQSSLRNLAERFRILFYLLLPVIWLPTSYRRLDEEVLLVLWLSPLIAIVLAHLTKAKQLQTQSKVLFVALTFTTLFLLLENSTFVSLIGVIAYILVAALSYFLSTNITNKDDANSKSTLVSSFINSWAINSIGFMLAIILANEFNSSLFALLMLSMSSIGVLSLHKRFTLCRQNKTFHLVYLAIASLISWGLLFDTDLIMYAMPPALILFSAFVLNKRALLPISEASKSRHLLIELSMHTYLLVTYLLSCIALSYYNAPLAIAPLLAVHGAAILFLKNRNKMTVRYSFILILLGIAKLALVDTANVILWQKVILFIGIGVFILFASFWYQKLVSKDVELAATD